MQFFTTVYFDHDDGRTLHLMTTHKKCQASMSELGEITRYPFHLEENENYARAVEEKDRSKDALHVCYSNNMSFVCGNIKNLPPKYDCLCRIFWVTIAQMVGDSSEIRSTIIDILIYAHKKKMIDVLDFIFEELRTCVFEKKSCIYAPFLQDLFEKKLTPAVGTTLRTVRCETFKPPIKHGKKKGYNKKMEDRATYTPGLTTDPMTNISRAPPMSIPPMDKKEKNLFVHAFNKLFNMCKATHVRGVKNSNWHKRHIRMIKEERRARGEMVEDGFKDKDSEEELFENPLANFEVGEAHSNGKGPQGQDGDDEDSAGLHGYAPGDERY